MNEKTLKTLEYTKINEILMSKAVSTMGKERVLNLKPSKDFDEIKIWQKQTTESSSIIVKKGSISLGGLRDIRESLKRSVIGGILSIEELLYIGDFLYVCKKAENYFKEDNHNNIYTLLEPLFLGIIYVKELAKEISRCIISQTEIADDSSSELYNVRRNIRKSNERIKEQLNIIIQSQAYKNMLQDPVITIRSGRYCVPIKNEYRNSFQGMVHDQSQSGATLFIEPISVVQLNNKIKELSSHENIEIEKVLKKLSQMISENFDILSSNHEILTEIDFIFAKGELSLEMRAIEPIFNNHNYISIKRGRHPLLNPKTVVPIDVYLGKNFTSLLITGPNTGGKTVALKTLGLFTLMGQAGLHIPAFDNSELAVFENIFVDIGDEQSIEQSLSTFSSHMSNIVKILEDVTDNSLVLLDELGAGTDPTEGAALAISILQYLHQRQICTAVTTHYSELKVYALSNEGVENASCEFDVGTLKPTYKLLIGIPGKSNAFAISKKLGLPDHIINYAKETLSLEETRFEDVITDLEISKKTSIIEKDRAEQFRKEAENLKSSLAKEKENLNLQRDKIILEAREEARKIMYQTKDEADRLLKELQKQMKEQSFKDAEITRKTIKEKLRKIDEENIKNKSLNKPSKPSNQKLKIGDKVIIQTLNRSGILSTFPDSNGDMYIQAGIMKIKANTADVYLDESEETIKINKHEVSHSLKAKKTMHISHELDLRGEMVSDALEKTDKYLDDAYLSGLGQATIIHGKGTGALRTAIHTYLKKHPHIKSFRLGVFGEGDSGVTIVEFD